MKKETQELLEGVKKTSSIVMKHLIDKFNINTKDLKQCIGNEVVLNEQMKQVQSTKLKLLAIREHIINDVEHWINNEKKGNRKQVKTKKKRCQKNY